MAKKGKEKGKKGESPFFFFQYLDEPTREESEK